MSISFHGEPWVAANQAPMRRKAKDPRHGLVYRIHFAAQGWMNQVGHSDFKGLTLAEILADKDGKQPDRHAIDKAIRKAKTLGLIVPESNARCLVLPGKEFQKQRYGSRSCGEHGVTGKRTPERKPDGS